MIHQVIMQLIATAPVKLATVTEASIAVTISRATTISATILSCQGIVIVRAGW